MQKQNFNFWRMLNLFFALFFLVGCAANQPIEQIYSYLEPEAEWIQKGEPIEFQGQWWYPADDVENLLDTEVYSAGEYKGVQIFIEKTDVFPYERVYTKFAKNKFRYFRKNE